MKRFLFAICFLTTCFSLFYAADKQKVVLLSDWNQIDPAAYSQVSAENASIILKKTLSSFIGTLSSVELSESAGTDKDISAVAAKTQADFIIGGSLRFTGSKSDPKAIIRVQVYSKILAKIAWDKEYTAEDIDYAYLDILDTILADVIAQAFQRKVEFATLSFGEFHIAVGDYRLVVNGTEIAVVTNSDFSMKLKILAGETYSVELQDVLTKTVAASASFSLNPGENALFSYSEKGALILSDIENRQYDADYTVMIDGEKYFYLPATNWVLSGYHLVQLFADETNQLYSERIYVSNESRRIIKFRDGRGFFGVSQGLATRIGIIDGLLGTFYSFEQKIPWVQNLSYNMQLGIYPFNLPSYSANLMLRYYPFSQNTEGIYVFGEMSMGSAASTNNSLNPYYYGPGLGYKYLFMNLWEIDLNVLYNMNKIFSGSSESYMAFLIGLNLNYRFDNPIWAGETLTSDLQDSDNIAFSYGCLLLMDSLYLRAEAALFNYFSLSIQYATQLSGDSQNDILADIGYYPFGSSPSGLRIGVFFGIRAMDSDLIAYDYLLYGPEIAYKLFVVKDVFLELGYRFCFELAAADLQNFAFNNAIQNPFYLSVEVGWLWE